MQYSSASVVFAIETLLGVFKPLTFDLTSRLTSRRTYVHLAVCPCQTEILLRKLSHTFGTNKTGHDLQIVYCTWQILNLPCNAVQDVVQDLCSTDPTQEACTCTRTINKKSYKTYGCTINMSYYYILIIQLSTGQESFCPQRCRSSSRNR